MARQQLTRNQRQEIIDDQATSGFKIAEYCQQNRYSQSNFYHWKSQLKPKARLLPPADDSPVFVPLDSEASTIRVDRAFTLELSLGPSFRLSLEAIKCWNPNRHYGYVRCQSICANLFVAW